MLRGYRYRKSHGWVGILLVIISLGFSIAQQEGWLDEAGRTAVNSQPGLYSVSRFSDGDTISINMNGKTETIRLIGVDTPETHKPNAPVQCYGAAASAFTKNFIGDKRIRLEADSKSTNRDRYDRLLRYVYLTDGTLVNKRLIEEGYGFYYPYFPFDKSDEFEAAQQKAIDAKRGVWGNCQPTPTDRGGWISNDL